jgi:lysophospholipase L1-like esterase
MEVLLVAVPAVPSSSAASIPLLARGSAASDHDSIMPRRLPRVALATGATVAALLLGELLWRAFRTARFGPTTNPAYVLHDDELGWRYAPLARARHQTDDFDVGIELNAQGFRDAPFDAHPGRTRIVALGDSLTFGWGVEASQGFTSRLEALLGADVINLGVGGYGTDQELLLWGRVGRALQPKLVLLTVCANDLQELSRPAAYGRYKPRLEQHDGTLRLLGTPVPDNRLADWSHLARSAWAWTIKRSTPPLTPAETPVAASLQCALIARLADEVQAAGARLLVVIEGPEPAADCPHDPTAWDVLDVQPALQAAARTGPVRFATDAHWTALGHQAVAEAIAARLRERDWLR